MEESPPQIDVEVLYHPECGHVRETLAAVQEAIDDLHLGDQARIREHVVKNLDEAREVGFRGSPTIRINGSDVEEWENRPRLHCREFPGPEGETLPHPSTAEIRAALRDRPRPQYDFEAQERGAPQRPHEE